jgi:hypothetical protein
MRRVLIFSTIGILLALTIFMVNGSASLVKAQITSNMTKYTDSQGRFSVSYPVNWTATPSTNRFQSTLVKFDNGAGSSMSVDLVRGATDPEEGARTTVNLASFQYTLTVFQPVECTKYKIDGQKACSFILTKSADANMGTPGRVVMGVDSYVNGKAFALTFASNEDTFDSVLPVIERMINSFKG